MVSNLLENSARLVYIVHQAIILRSLCAFYPKQALASRHEQAYNGALSSTGQFSQPMAVTRYKLKFYFVVGACYAKRYVYQ